MSKRLAQKRKAAKPAARAAKVATAGHVNAAPGGKRLAGLGVRLRHARMVRGITLKMLSIEATCSESMLSKIENDKAVPSFGTLHRIATALGTNISELYVASN